MMGKKWSQRLENILILHNTTSTRWLSLMKRGSRAHKIAEEHEVTSWWALGKISEPTRIKCITQQVGSTLQGLEIDCQQEVMSNQEADNNSFQVPRVLEEATQELRAHLVGCKPSSLTKHNKLQRAVPITDPCSLQLTVPWSVHLTDPQSEESCTVIADKVWRSHSNSKKLSQWSFKTKVEFELAQIAWKTKGFAAIPRSLRKKRSELLEALK